MVSAFPDGVCRKFSERLLDPLNAQTLNTGQYHNESDCLSAAISSSEMLDSISKLKTGKSSGLDNLLSEMFKCSKARITPFLLSLFNLILSSGPFLRCWCHSIVVPLHKKKVVSQIQIITEGYP